ncbi:hypothetical protein KR059_011457 [Drosophila kikkawai]|nr:hypothetical protein KR059_011457 [Drosophila kikkawai]
MAAAPSRNRCRSKTMPGAQRLHFVLFVLLGLTLATLATGNDAISAPKSPKDLQQPSPNRQQDIEDDGATRTDKDFDFAAYVNDFNLQEEATIPEDIFDQHDGDIEDEDLVSPQMQYAPAPSGAAAPSGTDEEEEEVDDDDDEEDAGLGLMEHGQEHDGEEDEDASEAADIILESQRPTSRNFSVYLDPKKYQNNNSNKKRAKEKKNNISHYNDKLKNNKENQPATKATKATDGAEGGEGTPPLGGTTFTSGDEDNANFGRQSFAYKKFKNMHEQQNQQQHQKEQQQQQQQQQEQEQHQLPKEQRKRGDDGQQQLLEESQLFDSIEILNERKFNKPNGGQEQEQHGARQVDEAIGDIEDNLDNDEVLPTDNDSDGDDDDDDVDGEGDEEGSESLDIKLPHDNDGLPNKKNPSVALTTAATPKTTTDTTTTRATATTSTTTTTTLTPTTTTSSSTTKTPTPTIGHKQKRHGGNVFGLQRPIPSESRYYGSNYEIGKIRQQEQEEEEAQQQDSEEDQDLNLGEMHYYDNGNIKRKLATFDTARSEDLPENILGSSTARKLQQPRFVDDDYAEQQPPQEEEEEKTEVGLNDGKLSTDVDTAWQRYHQDTTESPTSAPESAFERFKALRRSRQRTGHKSHKKRYKDYLKRQPAGTAPPPEPTASARHLQKLQKERQKGRERSFSSHSPPIFAVGLRPQKPFYEGQVNYFDHHQLEQEQEQQQQLEEDLKHRTEMERLIAHDNGNWYRRISPVLRNGVKTTGENQKHHHQHHQHHHSGHLANHHHHQHSHHYNHHRSQHSHHQKATSGSLRSRPSNPYQRKPAQISPGGASATSSPPPTPPLPPPKPQLGHQITELQHLERYYAKWPHLARVQFQVYDEHYRESHPELYSDYEDDYESAAELEEAQQERGEDANLPPYIKKYNRRNKQLLNLLEGTLPTPTNAPPPPGSSTESGIRLDDEYLKEKRRRYHQHQHQQRFDLFAQQRSHLNATETSPDEEYKDEIEEERRTASTTTASNHLPEEDVAASDSVEEHPDPAPASAALDFWQREMANKASATSTSTPKPALFKLPSYPAIAGSFLGTPRSRSRSAQFVANVAGRGQNSWPRLETTVNATAEKPAGGGDNPPGGGGGGGRGAPSPLNSFVYHRVVDDIGMANGIGGGIGSGLAGSSRGKQSRLPFVAITDRRLDRSLGERHKDFEQNHYPMP